MSLPGGLGPGGNGSWERRRWVPAFPLPPLEKACREPFEQVEQLVRQVLGGVSPKGRRRDGREEESQQGRSQGAQELQDSPSQMVAPAPGLQEGRQGRGDLLQKAQEEDAPEGESQDPQGLTQKGRDLPSGESQGAHVDAEGQGDPCGGSDGPQQEIPQKPAQGARPGGGHREEGEEGEPQKAKGKPVHRRPEGGQSLAKLEERIPFGGGRLRPRRLHRPCRCPLPGFPGSRGTAARPRRGPPVPPSRRCPVRSEGPVPPPARCATPPDRFP